MKSGPTLAAATPCPARRKAAINPVAMVVFPTPEWVPATTTLAPRCTEVRVIAGGSVHLVKTRALPVSVLDPLLGADAAVVGVLDLPHLGDGVGHLDQLVGGVATRDDDVGARVAILDPGDD